MSQLIPLTTDPQQTLSVTLNVDGGVLRLQLYVYFSEMAQYWLMNVSDSAGNLLLASVPMVTGSWPSANLLAQYGYLAIGSAYIINAGNVDNDYPDETQLGSAFLLLWDDTAV